MGRFLPYFALCGLLTLLSACPGTGLLMEQGEQCWDSKDNDSDGRVDCQDPDCAALGICSLRLDAGAPDRAKPPKKDSGVKKDKQVPRDVKPPVPDKNITYSYGRKCVWSSRNRFCPDGRSVCIIGMLKGNRAYCTKPCAKLGDICPRGPGGSFAACLYKFNGKPYCSFLCKLQGKGYKCPTGFGCHPWTSTQSYCWP
jgi:hypothetical protein